MGDTLDYERGKLCIGRKVKLNRPDGRGSGNGGCVATLKAAFPRYAKVRPASHGRDEMVPWAIVEDWVAGNNGPAPMPVRVTPPPTFALHKPMPVIRRVPEMTALEHKDLKAMQPTTIQPPASVAALRSAVNDADATLDLGDLGAKIKSASADLEAARAMLKDAQGEVTARENRLRELRALAVKALAQIDGTLGAKA